MPKITKITQQKKLADRFSLYVDGKFAMGVDGSLVVKHDLRIGTEFSDALKHELENADRIELAYVGLINFIAFRERCEHEVHQWLYKKGFPDLEDELVHRLKSRNYLRNERFTKLFIRDRVKLKGWGPTRLRHELRQKRIEQHIIENALEEISEDVDFVEMARELVQRKLRHTPRPTYKNKKQLFSLLQRRGYSANHINQALSGIVFHSEQESDPDF